MLTRFFYSLFRYEWCHVRIHHAKVSNFHAQIDIDDDMQASSKEGIITTTR
jgi:hypothetical protein